MRRRWVLGSALVVITACLTLVFGQFPASAIDPGGTPSPVTGNATWFSGLGSPYGGCGLPQANLDSQNFLALNVQNSPGNYSDVPRPISAANAALIGMFDNGLNCDRWVKVTIGSNCNGTNDGAPNEPFCRGGAGFVADQFNGATLDMVVADSCDDGNAWCKDDPFHVDLHQASLNQFVLNGSPVGDMYPNSWNNRQVTWQFEPAPNYTGDINIGAIQGAQPFWPAIAVSHLANGIHGVQYFANGAWVNATMDSDQGDDYIIGPTTGAGTGGSQYEIQVTDASGNLINNGRVYNFTLPSGCTTGCSAPYTPITYTTSTGPVTSPSPTPTPTPTPTGGSGKCALTSSVVNSWSGGYQLQLTVTNTGTAPTNGWTAAFMFGDSAETIASSWNATLKQTGSQVSATNAGYNGAVAAGSSTTFGVVVNGSNSALSALSCTAT
ncbi:MAG: cellulose binding domain-containing protein [Streptosporangiaceae bacterium]|nr:cellulose binding domain-containing protein [Streptosporangiaceae bacterium]